MPPPPTPATHSNSMPLRPRPDRMKDSILKESSVGWANAISPLRIAKRDQFSPPSSFSPNPNSLDPTRPVARRTSNSYKHMFNNNLVSSSPFKSQLAPRQQQPNTTGELNRPRPVVPVARKVSGEKRPRPDSLIQQQEREDTKRVTELGYKRRQSRGFQGLVEKTPVTKSPFRQLMSPGRDVKGDNDFSDKIKREEDEDMSAPIAIQFPTKADDTTSPETTETDSSLNSRASEQEQRPRTPPMHPTRPQHTPSPAFERRSPVPSALQGSPARSSLVQKSRLLGPRSRSLSAGASGSALADPPKRERRKTVTFDERCDVVEFDRESCEDAVFDTDDEDVYGRQESQQSQSQETSLDSSEYFDAAELNDSINGLVDSMLQEQQENTSLEEPSTPEAHSASLSSIVSDVDLMTGGAEDGVPLGRTHHVGRARAYQHDELDTEPPLPTVFAPHDASLSTPLRHESVDLRTPRAAPISSLPLDTEYAEDGMPLGRSHHAERVRAAHESGEDVDVKMLPPSPSPVKPVHSSSEREQTDALLPKLDLRASDLRTSSPCGAGKESRYSNDDVFGPISGTSGMLGKLDFEHSDVEAELLSNTSIASFHEFPPRAGGDCDEHEYEDYQDEDAYQRSRNISSGGRSDRSLDAIVSDLRLREEQNEVDGAHGALHYEDERERTESGGTEKAVMDAGRSEHRVPHEYEHEQYDEDGLVHAVSPSQNQNQNTDFGPHSPRNQGLYTHPGLGSANSLVGSDGRRSMSPRISREDVLRKLNRQRSAETYSPLGSPAPPAPLASSVSSMPKVEEVDREESRMDVEMEVEEFMNVNLNLPPTPAEMEMEKPQLRPPLEERLKRALSPSLPAPAPVRPAVIPSTSPAPSSPAAALPSHAVEVISPSRETQLQISSPPRVGHRGRAQTYDFDERPPPAPAKIVSRGSPMSSTFDFSQPGVDIGDMDMRSALERLVDDVSIVSGVERASVGTGPRDHQDNMDGTAMEGDVSMTDTELITEESTELLASLRGESVRGKPQLQRSGTAPPPILPTASTPDRPPMSRSVSEVSMIDGSSAAALFQQQQQQHHIAGPSAYTSNNHGSDEDAPPPLPPKTPEKSARQMREEMIKEKRREQRARESGEYFVPPRRDAAGNLIDESPASKRRSGQGQGQRPSMGRSRSAGDAEDLMGEDASAAQRRVSVLRRRRGGVLGVALDDDDGQLSDSIHRELRKNDRPKKTYELREYETVVYASSSQEAALAEANQSLDVEDKAWRTVRRPSDMDEYAREIKAIRAQEKPGKSHGRLFVKVLRLKGLALPLPPQLTMFTLTLNNGIHYVTTPECRLTREARIDQEFELIEHAKLEFSLSVCVRRDPHIMQLFKSITLPPLRPPQAAPSPPPARGVRSFFGGTPKKPKAPKHNRSQTEPLVRFEIEENLARYMKQDGTLARAFIAFKDIARHCDTRLFESTFPLIGQRLEAPGEGGGEGGKMVARQVGEIVLQMFRLPPLPGIPPNDLPQSLEECHRGLQHIRWHKETYCEGVLTQLGGDCSTWRRRQLRIIGGSIVAFSDVTKRAMATIDLKKALAVEDDQDPKVIAKRRDVDEYDGVYGVERSFRLVFPHKQEIMFFADTDEEKARWLEVLRALVGHIPPHYLWAELLWQRIYEGKDVREQQPQQQQQQQQQASSSSSAAAPNSNPNPQPNDNRTHKQR